MGLQNAFRIENDAQLLSALVNQINRDPQVSSRLPLP